MRRFIKTSVPTDGYTETARVGDRHVVRLEGVRLEGGITECYETMTDTEPDMDTLRRELAAWKAHLAERGLAATKEEKKRELTAYDTSEAVNSFALTRDGVKVTDYWLGRDLRTSLEGDVLAAQAVGDTYLFDIREMGVTLELDCNRFLAALARLRQYAYSCYNTTSRHLAAIDGLATEEEVRAYDFTTGYPGRLAFEIRDLEKGGGHEGD